MAKAITQSISVERMPESEAVAHLLAENKTLQAKLDEMIKLVDQATAPSPATGNVIWGMEVEHPDAVGLDGQPKRVKIVTILRPNDDPKLHAEKMFPGYVCVQTWQPKEFTAHQVDGNVVAIVDGDYFEWATESKPEETTQPEIDDLKKLKARIEELEDEVSSLESDVSEKEDRIEELKEEVSDKQGELDNYEKDYDDCPNCESYRDEMMKIYKIADRNT